MINIISMKLRIQHFNFVEFLKSSFQNTKRNFRKNKALVYIDLVLMLLPISYAPNKLGIYHYDLVNYLLLVKLFVLILLVWFWIFFLIHLFWSCGWFLNWVCFDFFDALVMMYDCPLMEDIVSGVSASFHYCDGLI